MKIKLRIFRRNTFRHSCKEEGMVTEEKVQQEKETTQERNYSEAIEQKHMQMEEFRSAIKKIPGHDGNTS